MMLSKLKSTAKFLFTTSVAICGVATTMSVTVYDRKLRTLVRYQLNQFFDLLNTADRLKGICPDCGEPVDEKGNHKEPAKVTHLSPVP